MCFLFVLPIALASSVWALFTVTKGGYFVILAATATEWNRRHGYKGGEGELSERENGERYGVKVDEHADHDLSRELGRLAKFAPIAFSSFVHKRYDITRNEGKLLRAILIPVIKSLDKLEGLKRALDLLPGNTDIQKSLFLVMDDLGSSIHPVILYLQQFPVKRVKSIKIPT